MTLDGDATGDCHCYTLTEPAGYEVGSIWSPETIDLTKPFDFTFQVGLGASDGGADGISFILSPIANVTGGDGGFIGYGGLDNTLGVEIDTWNNGAGWNDPPADHIAMNSNGSLMHNLEPAVTIPNVEDGATHDFRAVWDPATFEMDIFFDGTFIFTHTEDIVAGIFGGDPNVYFGWTGATGGATNLQTVCIDLEADFDIDDLIACPGQEIFFTNTSLNGLIYDGVGITDFLWTFAGADDSDLENPSHAFDTEGAKIISLTVTNLIGCTDEVTYNVLIEGIEIEVTGENATCFEASDGTATATPLSGDAPYAYLWDDPMAQTTATATDLGPGTYTVTVTDAMGCSQTGTIIITEPDELLIDEIITVNATCGLEDGELTLSATGGTPPYEYSIDDGGTFSPGATFIGLPDGDIDYIIRDANGCLLAGTAIIESNDLVVEMTQVNVSCFGFDDGQGTAAPEFGVGPCSFSWDDPMMQVTATATDLAPGTYTVTVMHVEIGCAGTGTVTITEPEELLVGDVFLVDPSCGVANGQITIEGMGGTLPYEYSIDGGTSYDPSPAFSGLAPGTYAVVLRDANGCFVSQEVTITNVSNVPEVIIEAEPKEGCRPLEVNFTNLSDPALTNSTEWDLGNGVSGEGTTISNTYTTAGCYDIHVTITTFDGCTTEATFTDYICAWELPIANFDYTPENPDVLHNQVDFINLSEFATTYEWDLGDGTTSTEFNPTHTYPQEGNAIYEVTLTATTDKGCTDSKTLFVQVDEVVQYYIPNTVTPDADPFNPVFQPVFKAGFYPQDYHFVIFNRWGEIIWESYDPSASWDVTYGGKIVDDGVYVWQLTFRESSSDKKYSDYGHVTVIK